MPKIEKRVKFDFKPDKVRLRTEDDQQVVTYDAAGNPAPPVIEEDGTIVFYVDEGTYDVQAKEPGYQSFETKRVTAATPRPDVDPKITAYIDTAIGAIPPPAPGAFKPNVDDTAIIPVDNNDSWIIGSDRMDNDAADATKRTRAWWSKAKGAFRSGQVTGTQWDDPSVGISSFAVGFNVVASGHESQAMGNTTTSSGGRSHAEGGNTRASGEASHAEGTQTYAGGADSHAEGYATQAYGTRSHAEGDRTQANGQGAHAEGASAYASGYAAHAEGDTTYATGDVSHASGRSSQALRYAQRAHSSGSLAATGDAQQGEMVLRRITTDATPGVLTAWAGTVNLTGTNTTVLTLPASRTFKVKIDVVARRADVDGEHAGWSFEGVVARDATGNAYFIGSLDGKAWGTVAAAAWDMTPSINTVDATNNYLALTATGEVAKTIRWVASLDWVEVG